MDWVSDNAGRMTIKSDRHQNQYLGYLLLGDCYTKSYLRSPKMVVAVCELSEKAFGMLICGLEQDVVAFHRDEVSFRNKLRHCGNPLQIFIWCERVGTFSVKAIFDSSFHDC